jgi:hypothetical protein
MNNDSSQGSLVGQVLRVVAGSVAGMASAFALVVAIELFSSVVHPVPEGFGGTKDEMCEHVARYPHWVLALVVPAWGVTAYFSTWVAKQIGGRGAALLVGALLVAAVVFNVSTLPYPIWFRVASLAAIPTAAVLAGRIRARNNCDSPREQGMFV